MSIVDPIEACESRMQQRMTAALRWITVMAGVVILAGGVLLLLRHGAAPVAFHTFKGEPDSLRSVPQILKGALQGHATAIIQLGILLLIITPGLRVLFVGIGYVIERDWLYVSVAAIVLAVLVSSLLGHVL
jgi:uncharacterized membrane protein